MLSGLTALTSLYLDGCEQLTDLAVLSGLAALSSLDLGGCCNLAFTPIRRLLDVNLKELYLYAAHFTDLPEAVCGERIYENCLTAVRAYDADLDAGAEEDAEIKVFVLGNGRVGKTQLSRRLMDEP